MKTNELRAKLVSIIDDIQSGKLSPADGRNIVGAANQINISIQNDLKLMKIQSDLGRAVTPLGNAKIT